MLWLGGFGPPTASRNVSVAGNAVIVPAGLTVKLTVVAGMRLPLLIVSEYVPVALRSKFEKVSTPPTNDAVVVPLNVPEAEPGAFVTVALPL